MVVRGESGGEKISYLEVSGKTGKVVFLLYAVASSIFTLTALNISGFILAALGSP